MAGTRKRLIQCFTMLPLAAAAVVLCFILVRLFAVMYGQTDSFTAQEISDPARIIYPADITYASDGISPNNADVETLCELPGVGSVTAQAFHDELALNGPFFYPEDLLAVKGIGEKKLENIRPLIRLP